MQYETKIQRGGGGISGYNEFSLKYDPGTQDEYAEKYGHRVDGQGRDVLYHTPDEGSPIPIRVTEQNKWIYLETAVVGDDENAIIASIAKLKRLVNDSFREGAETIRAAIAPNGSSYTTYYNILQGYIDDSGAYYEDVGLIARDVVLVLECEPGGGGDSFTLKNDLPSSPHFIEDSNSDGLADGWATSGMLATLVNSNHWLIGGMTQFFQTDAASNSLFQSSLITATAGSNIIASCWITMRTASSDDIYFRITDGAGTTTVEKSISDLDTSNAATSTISPTGVVFYKIELTGTITAANFRVSWIRKSTDATKACSYYIDGAYAEIDATEHPQGWCSSSALKNRYDPTSASAATQQQINYLDVWGIPGDLPALVSSNITQTVTGGGRKDLYIIRYTTVDGENFNTLHYIDSDQFSSPFGSGTWATGTGTVANHYYRCSSTTGRISSEYYESTQIVPRARRNWRVYGICRASTLTATMTASFGMFDSFGIPPAQIKTWFTSEAKTVTTVNTWELIDFGLLSTPQVAQANYTDPIFDVAANTGTVDFDGYLLLPVIGNDNFLIADSGPPPAGGSSVTVWEIDAVNEAVKSSVGVSPSLGGLWFAEPGNKLSRTVFATALSTAGIDITEAYTLELTVIPRTSHLLGA